MTDDALLIWWRAEAVVEQFEGRAAKDLTGLVPLDRCVEDDAAGDFLAGNLEGERFGLAVAMQSADHASVFHLG